MFLMERSEPSLIPEWLKGASGSALTSPHLTFYQEYGGNTHFSRPRATQQVAGSHTDYDSPRGPLSSEWSCFSSGKKSYGTDSLDRTNINRDIHSQGRLNSSLSRSSSSKQGYATQNREKEQEGNRAEVIRERDRVQDGERPAWSRDMEVLSGITLEEKKKERERLENGRLRLSIPGKLGSYESDAKVRRPQSMGLSLRMSDSNAWKGAEGVTVSLPMPSASSGLATSIQKAAFERNFPSLGVDDKSAGLPLSSVSSPLASPRPFWQSPVRSDLSRASSPGLVGSMGSPSITSSSINGVFGGDLWNSVLAEVPSSNDNMQNFSLGMSALSCSSASPSYGASSGPSSASTAPFLNMAEALSQPPPRVRTPPQSSAESQRLEELALKQSRQLIPMTPSLPKTMSFSDKGKSKTTRAVDGIRTSSSPKPDTAKHTQGKLLVLKANKDGGMKSEGSVTTQSSPRGSSSAGSLPILGAFSRKPHERRGLQTVTANVDAKDPTEEKRPSIQAQNRSDFFNALRKKAAGNGSSSLPLKSDVRQVGGVGEAAELEEAGSTSNDVCGGGANCECHIHSNGVTDVERKSMNEEEVVCTEGDSFTSRCAEEVDSEEEEAAFMRSLGWEENAEDSELTEEEINAFYQMREKRKLLGNEGRSDVGAEPSSSTSKVCLSSSESESESDDDVRA